MKKTLIITPREKEILDSAQRFSVFVGARKVGTCKTEQEARTMAEALFVSQPVMLYAVGEVCGIEAAAMFACLNKFGWNEGVLHA